jgi:hypothetical protein
MKTLPFLLFSSLLVAQMPPLDFSQSQKIAVQNAILAKVNGKTISMIDVKKKMDLAFHQYYPQLADSNQARFQFYEMSWKNVLMEMIDQELIISEATDKEIKLTDGEIREVMQERFGPNVTQTLDRIGLTYDETWKMIKDELIVQRMTWWFVQSKAISQVTPQSIRQAYRDYLEKNPPYSDWKYRVVSIKGDETIAEQVYELLSTSGESPEGQIEALKAFDPGIAVSNEFSAKDIELSEMHRKAIANLEPGIYSKPIFQMGKDKKGSHKIFYLIAKEEHPAPPFETLALQLRTELTQRAIAAESQTYLSKLRRHYNLDSQTVLPEDLHPFSLQ